MTQFRHKRLLIGTRHLVLVLIGLIVLSPFGAIVQGQQTAATTTLRPGIVIDPATNTAYTMTPEGVAAIDLASGAKQWTSNAAALPLAINGNLLISQVEPRIPTNRLELAVLDTRARGATRVRSTAELPSFVKVSIGQNLEGRFEADARMAANNAIVGWKFEAVPLRGALEEPESGVPGAAAAAGGAAQRTADGAVEVDLTTGAVRSADASLTGPEDRRRWLVSPNEKISAAAPAQYESADGRHIVASQRIADDRTWDKYRWTVFERGTNRRVGEFRTHIAFAPFVVRDSILIYETTPYIREGREEPAKLRGVNLATGQEAWSSEVRELEYRGPFPP